MKAYCVQCAKEQELTDVSDVTMKEDNKASKGVCAVCGDTVFVLSDEEMIYSQK
ncbi:hypothetical protein KKH43_00555 [Patescibacteria group bacterium]|nr:hypothetical protein [Patescibacteria group bacterium]